MIDYYDSYNSALGKIDDKYYKLKEISDIDSLVKLEEKNNTFIKKEEIKKIITEINPLNKNLNNYRPPKKEINGYLLKIKSDVDSKGKIYYTKLNKDEIYLRLEMKKYGEDIIEVFDFDTMFIKKDYQVGEYRYYNNNFIFTIDENNNEIYKLYNYTDNNLVQITDKSSSDFIISDNNIVYIEKDGFTGKKVKVYNFENKKTFEIYDLIDESKTLALEEYDNINIFNIIEDGHNSRVDNLCYISNNSIKFVYKAVSDEKIDSYITSFNKNIFISCQDGEYNKIYKLKINNGVYYKGLPLLEIRDYVIDYIVTDLYIILNLRDGASTYIKILDHDGKIINIIKDIGYSIKLIEYNSINNSLEYSKEGWLESEKRYIHTIKEASDKLVYKFFLSDDKKNGIYEQKNIKVRDGEIIEVTFIKGNRYSDKVNKSVVYFYGAYGEAIEPFYSLKRNYLLNKGYNYVIIHVRGGGENGREWHNQGRLFKKTNTFYDAIDVIEYLRKTNEINDIVLEGDSAGGAAVAAVLNYENNIALGALLAVPFLDVFATMNDPELPLTKGEYCEWGNPNSPIEAKNIISWSPIDNINNKKYPPILVTVGANDPRVGFWEGVKYCYKLRDLGNNETNLYIISDGGHNGSSNVYDDLYNKAIELCWIDGIFNK